MNPTCIKSQYIVIYIILFYIFFVWWALSVRAALHAGDQYQTLFVQTLFLCKCSIIYVRVCAQKGTHVTCCDFYRQLVRTTVSSFHFSPPYSPPLSLLPPWATSSGNGEGPVSSLNAANVCLRLGTRAQRHTQSWHTQRSALPLSPLCHIPSLLLPSPSFPSLFSHSPPCIPHSLPASSPTLHCTQCLNIFQLFFFFFSLTAFLGCGCYNHLHLPY